MRMHVLNMLYPARTAGGEHGKLCAGLELFHKLRRFLHDGEVGRQRGVENIVCAEHLERGYYLAHDRLRGRQAELLADTDTNRRGDLNGYLPDRIVNCLPEL